jgi:hypothetical protein
MEVLGAAVTPVYSTGRELASSFVDGFLKVEPKWPQKAICSSQH